MIFRLIDRLIVVVFALLFMQAPQFVNLYQERLGGHVDELKEQYIALESLAKKYDLTLEEWIKKTESYPKEFVQEQGVFFKDLNHRYFELTKSYNQLMLAQVWQRPFVFFFTISFAIAKETAKNFHPGFPMTFESILWGTVGAFLGYFFVSFILWFVRKIRGEKGFVA